MPSLTQVVTESSAAFPSDTEDFAGRMAANALHAALLLDALAHEEGEGVVEEQGELLSAQEYLATVQVVAIVNHTPEKIK